VLLYQGVRSVERKGNIERILVERISPALGGTFGVGTVRLGFLSASLRNVTISLPMRGVRINAGAIRVTFSLLKLILTRGDFSRSIGSVVLVDPRLDITLLADVAVEAPSPSQPVQISWGQSWPVEYLAVRGGSVTFVDRRGARFVFGERLNGRIWQDAVSGVSFEMRGAVASRRKNLSLSGAFSPQTGRNRISLRLDKARIDHPVSLGSFAVVGGTLDGVCEFGFDSTVQAQTLESSGWIRIDDGAVTVTGVEQKLTAITLRLRLDGSRWHVDTLSGSWAGVAVKAHGFWGISTRDSSHAAADFEGVDVGVVAPGLPPWLRVSILGIGWAHATVDRAAGEETVVVSAQAGGVTLAGLPVTRMDGVLQVLAARATLDSLRIETPRTRFRASGLLSYEKRPWGYSAECTFSGDSAPSFPQLQGRLTARGDLHGVGPDWSGDAELRGVGLRWSGVPIGDPRVAVHSTNRMVTFFTQPDNREYVLLQGDIDSLDSRAPVLHAQSMVGVRTMAGVAALMPAAAGDVLRNSTASLTFAGSAQRYAAQVRLNVRSRLARGGVCLDVHSPDKQGAASRWRMAGDNLTVGDTAFAASASGRWWPDSIAIDSMAVLGGLTGAGLVSLGDHPSAELSVHATQMPLVALNRWFFGAGLPVAGGTLSGSSLIVGPLDRLRSRSDLHFRQADVAGISPLSLDAVVSTDGARAHVPRTAVRMNERAIVTIDTLALGDSLVRFSGSFDGVVLSDLLKQVLPEDLHVTGAASGSFAAGPRGLPIAVKVQSSRVTIDRWALDSIRLSAQLLEHGIAIGELRAADSTRCGVRCSGFLPYAFLVDSMGDADTVLLKVRAQGDLLAGIGKNVDSPVNGHGIGVAQFVALGTTDGWSFPEGTVTMPKGTMTFRPFLKDRVDNLSFSLKVVDSTQVEVDMRGQIGRKHFSVLSSHDIPSGYEPIQIGPLDLGVLQMWTPDRGIPIHVPGFMAIGETGDVEFAAKKPFDAFTLAGPADKITISGTWVLQDVEFTYPFLDEKLPWDFDPMPYVTWDLDIKPGRRTVYYWDLRSKRRQLVRFFEATADRSSWLSVRGRLIDNTLRLDGVAKSFKGAIYYGKVFDRNVRVALEFTPLSLGKGLGYNNYPILSGSAEAFSDSSRFDRITLTLRLTDPTTGSVAEKGRVALIPASKLRGARRGSTGKDSTVNFVFHLSSGFEEIPGESERDFYQEAGVVFGSLEGAGQFVGSFGEQYLHRFFLQRFERRLAKALGLDVISFESSIASNYFSYLHGRPDGQDWNRLSLLANMGVTFGRYFLRDYLFVKARGEFVPTDTLVRPEYSLGFEFMPAQYFMMDVSNSFYVEGSAVQYNPRIQMQLRLPIKRLRNFLNF
jgi:hypothetical protein